MKYYTCIIYINTHKRTLKIHNYISIYVYCLYTAYTVYFIQNSV